MLMLLTQYIDNPVWVRRDFVFLTEEKIQPAAKLVTRLAKQFVICHYYATRCIMQARL